ncbi:MAG TPA: hypothetical protein VGE21_02505 [Flavobacteriales bacterium]
MNKRTVLVALLVVLLVGGAIAYRLYHTGVPQAAERTADVSVPAEELFQAFQTDEVAAGQRFNDKVVSVTGTVRDILREKDGRTTVTLESGDPLGGIVCEFAPGTDPGCTTGEKASIKGFCAGFNLDVLLQRCAKSE